MCAVPRGGLLVISNLRSKIYHKYLHRFIIFSIIATVAESLTNISEDELTTLGKAPLGSNQVRPLERMGRGQLKTLDFRVHTSATRIPIIDS
jgi:hypothetical protein